MREVSETEIQTVIEATGGLLSNAEATKLLKSKGSTQAALNAFFDNPDGPSTSQRPSTTPPKPPSKPTATQTKGTSSQQRPNKRAKSDASQRSITAFFTSPTAAKDQPPSPEIDLTFEDAPTTAAEKFNKLAKQQQQTIEEEGEEEEEEADVKPTKAIGVLADNKAGVSNKDIPADAVLLPLTEYNPLEHAPWTSGPTPYLHIARALSAIDSTKKRLLISDALVNTFRTILALQPNDVVPASYLMMGAVGPRHETNLQLGVGGSTVASAVSEVTAVSRGKLSEMYKEYGDLGDVAEACKRRQKTLIQPETLTVASLMKSLRSLAEQQGQGANVRKQQTIARLLRACRESEIKYLVRMLVQALRVGASETSIVSALGKAIAIHKSANNTIPSKQELDAAGKLFTEAFHTCPDFQLLTRAALDHPLEELPIRCASVPGIPVRPMLAKISQGVADAVGQLKGASEFLAERKYDGMRAQIHLVDNNATTTNTNVGDRVFSRNSEDNTRQNMDVLATVRAATGNSTTSLIIDAEIVAVARDTDGGFKLRSFQELMTRSKTGGTDSNNKNISSAQDNQKQQGPEVCVFVFDLLHLNGENWMDRPLKDRREELIKAFPGFRPGYIQLAEGIIYNNATLPSTSSAPLQNLEQRLEEQMLAAFESGTEGLMLKALNAKYEPSKRSEHWIKLKRDYIEGLADTLELVVIGAWHGNGRKVKWYSPFLLAAYDPDTETFQSVCRCMSGFSDEFYQNATKRLQETIIPGPRPYYVTTEQCDVWFDAKEVWEIRGADLTLSTTHKAAVGRIQGAPDRGVSLRFPRFIKTREDKAIEDATSAEMIAQLYDLQTRKVG